MHHFKIKTLDESRSHHSQAGIHRLKPVVQLFVYLSGSQQFYIDDIYFNLDAGTACDPVPQVLMFNLTRGATLRLQPADAGHALRKVSLSAQPGWLETLSIERESISAQLRRFMDTHRGYIMWEARSQQVSLAKQIMELSGLGSEETRVLSRAALGLELASDIFSHMKGEMIKQERREKKMQHVRTTSVKEYLLQNLSKELSIEEIASATGTSKRSIQRHFKGELNMSVSEFLRKARLERARQAIANEGMSISQAAYMAGYNNPSSFSNAFRKVYGSAPRDWKKS